VTAYRIRCNVSGTRFRSEKSLLTRIQKIGPIICIERSRLRLLSGVPELIFVGLFHFARRSRCRVLEILGKLSPRSIPPTTLFLFLPFFFFVFTRNLAVARPLVFSYYFRWQSGGRGTPAIIHILKATLYTACPTLFATPHKIISKNICGIDVAIIIAKCMALDDGKRSCFHVFYGGSIYNTISIYNTLRLYSHAETVGAENLSRWGYSKNVNYRYCSLFLFVLPQV